MKTIHGQDRAAEILDFLRTVGSKPPSKQWAHDILNAAAKGEGLCIANPITGDLMMVGPQPVSDLQIRLAREALGLDKTNRAMEDE